MSFGMTNRSLIKTFRFITFLRSSSVIRPYKSFFGTLNKLPHASQNLNFKRITSYNTNKSYLSTTCNENQSLKNINYEDVIKAQQNDKILIIDVREQNEINETGKLPGSIHIPMGNVTKNVSSLTDNEFKSLYGKDKPTKDTCIILSCRSGKRSATVQEELQKLGYKNALNYIGGWLDWEKHTKK